VSTEHVRTVTREFATGEPAVLHLESRSGAAVVEGRETDVVRVEAVLRIWSDDAGDADDAAALVERGMEMDGRQRVIVRAPALPQGSGGGWSILQFGQRGSRLDYHVRVPRRTAVRVLSRSGRVEIRRIEGRTHTEVISGRCTVEDVTGDVTAISRSGAMQIDRVEGSVTAEARSGRLHIAAVRGRVVAEARSGAVELAHIVGDARVSARSGSITVEDVAGGLHARSKAGSFRYRGAVRGDFDIEVGTGPITLAVDPDVPFFVDAESRVGPVTSDLPPRRGGAGPPAGGPKVRLRAITGPIRLTRAD